MTTRLAVFDGRSYAGFVEQIDGQWRAIATNGEVIGTYPDQRAAARALPAAPKP
jgi:hypothetical protein